MLSSPIEEIKNRLNIVDVIGGYVRLQKAGANMRALCPFHSEKTPSFFVSPARQVWRCFGCGVGGDAFKFIMQIEGIEFGDALRQLAQKAGVELKKASPLFLKAQTERKRLFELVEWAAKFFEKQLSSSQGLKVHDYLAKRGFSKESVAKWRVGYAPESARSLSEFLSGKGFRQDEISRAGLLVNANGQTFDRFRSRIMFPVFDINSQVAGFGARIFGEKSQDKELAKYINTSNTPLYDKSRILYGLDKAKLAIRQQNCAILVEGYVDTILVSQAQSENVVAVSGTALTPFHLRLLKRYSDNLILSFDMDLGGDTATKRGIDLAISEGFNVKVATMQEGKDPADVVAENPAQWKEVAGSAKSIFDFYFEQTLSKFSTKTAEGKKEISRVLLPLVKKIPNRIEQAHWINLLSKELEIKDEIIEHELKRLPREESSYIPFSGNAGSAKTEPKTRKQRLEERIFILLSQNSTLLSYLSEQNLPYFSLQSQEIIEALLLHENPSQFNFEALKEALSEELFEFVEHIALRASVEEWERNQEPADAKEEFTQCLTELEKLNLREKLGEISRQVATAQQSKDHAKIKTLMEQFQQASKHLHLSA